MENDYTKGHDNYPTSVADAFQMLSNYKQYNKTQPAHTGVSFAECGKGRQNKGKNGNDKDLANVECYHCHKKGHYANKCPDKKDNNNINANSGTTNTNVATTTNTATSANTSTNTANTTNTSTCHLNM